MLAERVDACCAVAVVFSAPLPARRRPLSPSAAVAIPPRNVILLLKIAGIRTVCSPMPQFKHLKCVWPNISRLIVEIE